MAHTPPPGAEDRIDVAAQTFLAQVQTALGTTRKPSVLLIALGGLLRIAATFGMSVVEIDEVQLRALRHAKRDRQG